MIFTGYILLTITLCISVADTAPRIRVGPQGLYDAYHFDKKTNNAPVVSFRLREYPDVEASIEQVCKRTKVVLMRVEVLTHAQNNL